MPIGVYKRKLFSEETRKKMSLSHIGIKFSEKHRQGVIRGLMGRTCNKGKSWSEARRRAQIFVTIIRKPIKKNGKKYSPYWHEIRKEVYKRDNWTCKECGCKCHNTKKQKIQCHHIDYDENNNKFSNLITLCASCHGKTNFTREDWIKHFCK